MRKIFLVIALSLLLLIGMVNATTVSFNDYSYYQEFTVNSTSSQTDFQVQMTLSNATGYSTTPGLYYTNGTTRTDWADVVWTDTSDTVMSFWKENRTDTSTTSAWWIKIPSVANDNTTKIRLWFSNTSQTISYADGEATFYFFDDFAGTSFDPQWNINTMTAGSVANSVATLSTSSATSNLKATGLSYGTNYAMRARATLPATYTICTALQLANGVPGSVGVDYELYLNSWQLANSRYWAGTGTYSTSEAYDIGGTYTGYRTIDIMRNGATNVKFNVDNNLVATASTVVPTSTFDRIDIYQTNAGTGLIDWILLRKYSISPPTLLSTGGRLQNTNPPVASFNIILSDTTTNNPSTWQWNYTNLTGDNIQTTFSTSQNPILSLTKGNYLIQLISTNSYGSNTTTKLIGLNLTNAPVYFWNRTS
jgi:hypothetical protein